MDKEQLEKLSDFEINIEICESIGVKYTEGFDVVFAAGKSTGDNVVAVMGKVDYCNNWSDMGPLIDSADISVIKDEPYSRATNNPQELYDPIGDKKHEVQITENCKTLRAAAIVYLLMQKDKK
jgi:hypothetical protein